MSLFLLGLAIALCVGASILAFMAYQHKQKQKSIVDELASEAHNLLDRMRKNHTDPEISLTDTDQRWDVNSLANNMKSPEYLTTLCTVMVKKAGGEIRLYEHDFSPITENDYVSVYIDMDDSSLLLRLNSIVDYMPSDDDGTYH